jgi:hypothetical protein
LANGNVSSAFSASKKGKTATLSYSGVIFTPDAIPISTVITLGANGKCSVSSTLLGLGTGVAIPSTGTIHFSKHGFNFVASEAVMGTSVQLSGNGVVRDTGKKRTLTLTLVVVAGSDVINFNNTLTAKAPKK